MGHVSFAVAICFKSTHAQSTVSIRSSTRRDDESVQVGVRKNDTKDVHVLTGLALPVGAEAGVVLVNTLGRDRTVCSARHGCLVATRLPSRITHLRLTGGVIGNGIRAWCTSKPASMSGRGDGTMCAGSDDVRVVYM